jgi:hypothetical protein
MKPPANDSRVVDGENVAGRKLIRQVEDRAVLEARRAMWPYNEEPRRVARFCGAQRNAFGRQIEIEAIDAHDELAARELSINSTGASGITKTPAKKSAWEASRNKHLTTANWQFTTKDARIKIKRICPQFE